MPLKRSTILIIDSDLGSVFWLGQVLDAAGCEALPAKNVPDAKSLLAELKVMVDLLIVRSSMPGAAAFAESLCRSQGSLKTIGLRADDEELPAVKPQMDAWLHTPFVNDETARFHYLGLISRVLGKGLMLSAVLLATAGDFR
jgi:hypothetical protein